MSEEQFAAQYAVHSGLTRAEYDHFYVTLPCGCGHWSCLGWAAVENNPSAIKSHNDLYAPTQEEMRKPAAPVAPDEPQYYCAACRYIGFITAELEAHGSTCPYCNDGDYIFEFKPWPPHVLPAAPVAQVPEGFVMVPAKPTSDQLIAGAKTMFRSHGTQKGVVGEMYAAMLATAPSAKGGE